MKPTPAHTFFTGGTPMQMMASWLALLCCLLLLPKIWSVSGWLANVMLRPEFGHDLTYWVMRPATFVCVVMVSIFAARATLGSSFAIIALTALTKLPIL